MTEDEGEPEAIGNGMWGEPVFKGNSMDGRARVWG